MISLKTTREIALMRDAGRIAAQALALVGEMVKPGITTWELARVAHKHIVKCGATPTFLDYNGFPGSICVSLNHEVIHGIPSKKRTLVPGDIVSVDLGATYKGYVGDTAATFPVGKISSTAQLLCDTTKASLYAAIERAQPGGKVGDISSAVQQICEAQGFSLVRDYTGHGVGRVLHEDPIVPNVGRAGHGAKLRPGMVLAIEPMVNQGRSQTRVLHDNWTVVTRDGKLSAHFEHTIAITQNGPVILTLLED